MTAKLTAEQRLAASTDSLALVLPGAGTDRSARLLNCFVMGNVEDGLDAVLGRLCNAASRCGAAVLSPTTSLEAGRRVRMARHLRYAGAASVLKVVDE